MNEPDNNGMMSLPEKQYIYAVYHANFQHPLYLCLNKSIARACAEKDAETYLNDIGEYEIMETLNGVPSYQYNVVIEVRE